MTREECISKIKRIIPDENVRDCIFGGDNRDEDDFLTVRSIILKYFSNIFNLAFVFIYARYKVWKEVDGVFDSSTPTNFLRVFDELEKIYTESPLTFDIMENLLVDIQLDIVTQGAICRELRLINKILKSDKFAKFAYKAKKARKSSRLSEEISIEERYDELIELLGAFPFLRDLSFEKKKMENVSLYADNTLIPLDNVYNISMNLDTIFGDDIEVFNKDLDTNCTIICKSGMYYCLERIDYSQDADASGGMMSLNYWLIGSYNESLEVRIINDTQKLMPSLSDCLVISYDTAFEDYAFRFLANLDDGDSEEEYRISNFYAINYKYIKNLALAISDVMQENGREVLTEFYGTKHRFERTDVGVNYLYNDRKIYYSWSEIISVLMIEEGTTNVLTFLLKKDKDIKDRLLHNLEFRFGKELFSKENIDSKIQNAYNSFSAEQKESLDPQRNTLFFKRELNDKYAEMCARMIIVGISHAINGNALKDYKPSFPLSIRSKKLILDEIKSAEINTDTKIEMLKQIVIQTFKTLYCFYFGFFGYANVKRDFDNESFYKSMSTKEIASYQKKAEDAFQDRVSKKLREFNESDTSSYKGLLISFKEFCLKCETSTRDNYSRILKDSLGKSKIMDTGDIDYLIRCFDGKLDEDDVEEVIDNIKSIFNYLQTGKRRKNSSSLGAIFPYVATCEYTDISRDGNEVYHFSIISKTGQELNLRVLSEFQYNLNEKYYFLPNKTSSDERLNLWIEPVLINYSNFELKENE